MYQLYETVGGAVMAMRPRADGNSTRGVIANETWSETAHSTPARPVTTR